jgi:enoyl-CoA hydratase/carnithine racemase
MIECLQSAIDSINYDKCRVLVISSSNHSIFSSGHNLKELKAEKGTELHSLIFKKFTNLCLSLKQIPIPTIAEVHGLAAAAGCQLAASCDLVLASNKSSFSTPGVKFGVVYYLLINYIKII